jgi:ABC-type glycerol-3-phosphate transport system substrate-binding protein
VIIVETRKRTVIFLLVIFVIFSAGCTKGTEEKPGQEPEETKLEPLTLRILTIGDSSVNGRQYEFSKIVDMASAMTMEKYNTAFVMEFIPKYDDYVLRVSSGEPADIICNPPGTEKLIEEGLLADLTELLPNLYPESYMQIQDIQDECKNKGVTPRFDPKHCSLKTL